MSAQIGQIKKSKDIIFEPVQGRTLKLRTESASGYNYTIWTNNSPEKQPRIK